MPKLPHSSHGHKFTNIIIATTNLSSKHNPSTKKIISTSPIMKLVLSFVTVSMAAAASPDGSFIRGSTHEVPTDIFAGLANGNNNFTPEEYCPRGSDYNPDGPEWPAESGCYPGTGSIQAGWPKCCDKGNCPNNSRPLCENSMASAPSYCADMPPDENCYIGGWPFCCLTDGTTCPNSVPPCNAGNRNTCNSSSNCLSNEFCFKQNGNCGQRGTCIQRPDMCSNINDPVCGCDGKTYSNACMAASNGRTTVRYFGKCDGDDDDDYHEDDDDNINRGECRSNSNCREDEFCSFPEGDCGDTERGECEPIPSGSDCDGVTNNAVCGCDNVKYKNWCKANQQGLTSIQNQGSCDNAIAFE